MIELSTDIKNRGLKILLWGAAGARKTETGLRYFPDCFIVDIEGNANQCVGVPEIKPFLRQATKDPYEVMEILDNLAAGKIKFPDGTKVQTVILDGMSVLWNVRQEVGALNAEKRAKKYKANATPDEATMTQLDWVLAKRPLKRISARLNNPGVKFVILTAREKDEYKEVMKDGKKELVKVGVVMEAMRGLDYETNAVFHMRNTTPWSCVVEKSQGLLGSIYPRGTELKDFPWKQLLDYATGVGVAQQDETEVAAKNLEQEVGREQADLMKIGKDRGMSLKDIADALKAAGIEKFDPERWDEMEKAVRGWGPPILPTDPPSQK
jgi:hypothetical protein